MRFHLKTSYQRMYTEVFNKSILIKKLNIINVKLSDGYIAHFPPLVHGQQIHATPLTPIPSKPLASFFNPQPLLMRSRDSCLKHDSAQPVLWAVTGISSALAYGMKPSVILPQILLKAKLSESGALEIHHFVPLQTSFLELCFGLMSSAYIKKRRRKKNL